MSRVPREVTLGYLAEELRAAFVWAERRGVDLSFDESTLVLTARFPNEAAEDGYLVQGDLTDYRVLPPAWRMLDPRDGGAIGLAAYPKVTDNTVFHSKGLICAPWNRLAYQSEGGIHGDWGDLSGWEQVRPGKTYAVTIPDMLQRMAQEIARSVGRMAALPARSEVTE